MNRAPKSTEAFDELIAALQEIRDGYVLDDQRFTEDLDVVEGFRYVTEVLSGASEFFMEADPDHPRMASIVTPARKLQGDNPDSIYHFARIDGGRSYRVSGVRGEEAYISFTVHAAAVDGGFNGRVLADINDSQFTFAPDGSYEIVFSAEPHDGNWVKLDPDARMIIVRSYFLRERSAQNDPTVAVRIGIECVDDVAPPPPLDDATFAGRLRDGSRSCASAPSGSRCRARRRRLRSWRANPTTWANRGASATRASTPPVRSTSSTPWAGGTSVPTTRWSCGARSRRRASPT